MKTFQKCKTLNLKMYMMCMKFFFRNSCLFLLSLPFIMPSLNDDFFLLREELSAQKKSTEITN